MDTAQLNAALTQAAQGHPLVVEVDHDGARHWDIALASDGLLMLDLPEGSDRLVFSMPIGRPPVDRCHLVYESLLTYNALWKETSGVRFGLHGAQGEVLLIFEHAPAALDAQTLASLLERVTRFADLWCGYVTAPASAVPAAMPASPMLVMSMLV